MKQVHWILTGLTFSIILLSINRLTPITTGYLQPFEFLRWLDFNAMLPIPLLSVLLYYFLWGIVSWNDAFRKTGKYVLLALLFISGVYFFAAGSGDHEVTNYLNTRFCERGETKTAICNIISYNDDEFSHYVYYFGFILLNVSLMFLEFFQPRKTKVTKLDLVLVGLNSLFIGLGIFANLAFEEIGLDIVFFGSVMVLALILLSIKKTSYRLPVTFYFAASYTLGVVGTIAYKAFAG